ncbi:MAG: TetR/AcrR family transcriptional regulator [Planctomycetota bacterium]
MVTLSRKQREMMERESQILRLARPILVAEGYQSLSMDRLAVEMEYAKGTLYNHFPNKEEIVAALAIESLGIRRKMFERASILVEGSRLRMTAIGCACDLYAGACPEHFAVEQMLRNAVIWEKSSEKRQKIIQQCELQCMGVVSGIVRDAICKQELDLPPSLSAEEFVFGFWSLTFGSQVLMATSPSLPDVGVNDPVRSLRFHGWTLMNGYGWKPLIGFDETQELMEELSEKILQSVEAE